MHVFKKDEERVHNYTLPPRPLTLRMPYIYEKDLLEKSPNPISTSRKSKTTTTTKFVCYFLESNL